MQQVIQQIRDIAKKYKTFDEFYNYMMSPDVKGHFLTKMRAGEYKKVIGIISSEANHD